MLVALLLGVLEDGARELLSAHNGSAALEVVHAERPDLVLSDVMMPGLDGRELCRRIKSGGSTSGIRVVLMSAGWRIDPGECGADAFIHKPFDVDHVEETIDRLLT